MSLKAYWAYVFTCDKPIEAILAAWNETGPWQWRLRDSAWYGDYLNTRPTDGVRVRIHEFPSQASEAGTFVGPGSVEGVRYSQGYTALLQIEPESVATKAEIDAVLQGLLERINAEKIKTIEPYD
ncbi:MAG: hypothetical protein HY527_22575 [Betaproteobacteria bacterium]|nr:hypothetical protein [Betaproteobacteria bacterium]